MFGPRTLGSRSFRRLLDVRHTGRIPEHRDLLKRDDLLTLVAVSRPRNHEGAIADLQPFARVTGEYHLAGNSIADVRRLQVLCLASGSEQRIAGGGYLAEREPWQQVGI